MTDFPLHAFRAPLGALLPEGAYLVRLSGVRPLIYNKAGDGSDQVAWEGNNILTVAMIKQGLIAQSEDAGSIQIYVLTGKGYAVAEALHNEYERMKARITELEEQIEDMKAIGARQYFKEMQDEAKTDVRVIPDAAFKSLRRKLTPAEMRMFELMATRPGQLMTKEFIHEAVLNPDTNIRIVDVQVCKLRKKLKKFLPEAVIETHRGRGYSLEMEDQDDRTAAEMD